MTTHTRRSFVRDLVLATAALPLASCARSARPQPVPRIGFLTGAEPSLVAAFQDEMRKLGYLDGRNIAIEMRLARPNTNDTAIHAAELGAMDLAFVVAAALPQALAMRQANPAMPMVIITCPGMISNGFAASLERPGGIYTGMDELPPGVTARRLQLLKTVAPGVRRVGLLSTTPGRGGHETQVADAEAAARELGIAVTTYRATSLIELNAALAAAAKDRIDGLLNFQGGLSLANRQLIVEFATELRVPAVYQSLFFVDAGGLMAWSPDQRDQYRMGARYADRILRGAKPGELPVQHPTPYLLAVSKRAASAIGLTLPPSILAEADRILS